MNLHGVITDNNSGQTWKEVCPEAVSEDIPDCLRQLAGVPLKELKQRQSGGVLVFPSSKELLEDGQKGLMDQPLFSLRGDKLATGNLMGFLGTKDVSLTIRSRFSGGSPKKDYFLYYLLQKVFALNLTNLTAREESDAIANFLVLLFPLLLKNAIGQGLYRTYRTFDRNDAALRGAVDVARHIAANIPFRGKVAYRTREYTTDNPTLQLIRHTIEYIRGLSWTQGIFFADAEVRDAVAKVDEATRLTYNRFDRARVIGRSLRPFSHPYYTEYKPLVTLCLQILRHEKNAFGSNDRRTYGILFDGAWLWEEYLATLLVPAGFRHPNNRTGDGRLYLYKGHSRGPIFPDFYTDTMVADAKYKRLKRKEDANDVFYREDRYQLTAYMHVLGKNTGILMYPTELPRNPDRPDGMKDGDLNGLGGIIRSQPFHIPSADGSYETFCGRMQDEELHFVKALTTA